jgi:hypothetical protein
MRGGNIAAGLRYDCTRNPFLFRYSRKLYDSERLYGAFSMCVICLKVFCPTFFLPINVHRLMFETRSECIVDLHVKYSLFCPILFKI